MVLNWKMMKHFLLLWLFFLNSIIKVRVIISSWWVESPKIQLKMSMNPCMAEKCLKNKTSLFIYKKLRNGHLHSTCSQLSPPVKWVSNSVYLIGLLLNDTMHIESLTRGLVLSKCSENMQQKPQQKQYNNHCNKISARRSPLIWSVM